MGSKVIKRTGQERQAQAEALHASIVEQAQKLTDSGQWRAFLEFARSFHNYSLNNLLLILSQNPNATMVAGFRQWQAKGRQVRRGEKAISILGYREKKPARDDSTDDALATDERVVRYFPTLSVFDIAQTDQIEGVPLPESPAQHLNGDDDDGVIAPLIAHLEANGWNVQRTRLTSASGYTDPESRRVILAEDLAIDHTAKTLIHETAHIELRHIDDIADYRARRGLMEVEAESVAYIVAGLAGLDTSRYSIGYITGWADADVTVIRNTAARVLKAARTIAEIIDRHQ